MRYTWPIVLFTGDRNNYCDLHIQSKNKTKQKTKHKTKQNKTKNKKSVYHFLKHTLSKNSHSTCSKYVKFWQVFCISLSFHYKLSLHNIKLFCIVKDDMPLYKLQHVGKISSYASADISKPSQYTIIICRSYRQVAKHPLLSLGTNPKSQTPIGNKIFHL